jgi:hypothetical protein
MSLGGFVRVIEDEQGMTAKAFFDAERDACFATVSWQSDPKPPNMSQRVGPVVVCLANSTIREDEFNAWHKKPGHRTLPPIEIGLAASQTPQDDPHLTGKRLWTNPAAGSARLFFRGCGESLFRTYSGLQFQPGAVQLISGTDPHGRFQVSLSAENVLLDEPDETTWQNLLQACNLTQHLPAQPFIGVSQMFTGGSFQAPPDPSTPFGRWVSLRDFIATLVSGKRLGDQESKPLVKILDEIRSALLKRADKALHELDQFRRKVGRLANAGAISPNDAGTLLSLVDSVTGSIETLFASPPLDSGPETYCPSGACPVPPPCAFTTLHVQQGSRPAGADGTPGRPFPAITAALAHAETAGLCGVELRVGGGAYRGDLNISRHTSILGGRAGVFILGSVVNRGGHSLLISRAHIRPVSIGGADAFGVHVDHPCANTVLLDVAILGATGYGIRHRGGTLIVLRSEVRETRSQPDFVTRGTGIYLTCGTRGIFTNLLLLENESAALHVLGTGTEVSATDLRVEDTGDHPTLNSFPLGMGALQVRFGALLRATFFRVERSRGVGIVVGQGGSAVLENGFVRRTLPRSCAETTCPEEPFGHNAAAVDGGALSMLNFALRDCGLCGLLIAPEDGQADLRYGEISGSPIGICLQVPGYARARLTDHVEFIDVGRDIEGTAFAVPEPSDPVELSP